MLEALDTEEQRFRSIGAMMNPRSIAIIGATEKSGYGGRLVNNIIATAKDARIYPINPIRETVHGIPCFKSIKDVPEQVDFVGIVIPVEQITQTLQDCADAGVKSALVVSGGFAEMANDEGRTRQEELRSIARASGMRICGPNCLGMANIERGYWMTPSRVTAPEMKGLDSQIALVSQSGATAYRPLLNGARDRGMAFRYLFSTGNEGDLQSTDFIEYVLADPRVKVVAAVIEGFKDGEKFVRVADRALAMGKPIVMLKVGRTEAGARGAGSHTASMTGSDVVQDALFRQKGVVRVDDYDQLLDVSNMLARAKAPRGNRVGVFSESGGMGSLMADMCAREGLEVPVMSAPTSGKIREILGPFRGSAANPADLTRFAAGPHFPTLLQYLVEEETQDILIMNSVGEEMQVKTIMAATEASPKPIFYVWASTWQDKTLLPMLQKSDVPVFYNPSLAAKGARALFEYHKRRRDLIADAAEPASDDADRGLTTERLRDRVAKAGGNPLTESESKDVLSGFGVPVTRERFCRTSDEAVRAACEIGYPVVMKVVSRTLTHKSDAGGVRLNLRSSEAVREAFDGIVKSVAAYDATAEIDGIVVQQMVAGGVETIVGVVQDPQFGPVVMLGLGGVLAEALGSAAWRVCPINRREAREMIGEVNGLSKLLAGFRGSPRADNDALVAVLVAVSRMAMATTDEIAGFDINPLTVLPEGQGAVALDALIMPNVSTAETQADAETTETQALLAAG